jgi:hypothetical protein
VTSFNGDTFVESDIVVMVREHSRSVIDMAMQKAEPDWLDSVVSWRLDVLLAYCQHFPLKPLHLEGLQLVSYSIQRQACYRGNPVTIGAIFMHGTSREQSINAAR